MKQAILFVIAAALAAGAHAQSNTNVHDAARRPDRKEQSARADLYIRDKTQISNDSAFASPQKDPAVRGKKGCARKHRH